MRVCYQPFCFVDARRRAEVLHKNCKNLENSLAVSLPDWKRSTMLGFSIFLTYFVHIFLHIFFIFVSYFLHICFIFCFIFSSYFLHIYFIFSSYFASYFLHIFFIFSSYLFHIYFIFLFIFCSYSTLASDPLQAVLLGVSKHFRFNTKTVSSVKRSKLIFFGFFSVCSSIFPTFFSLFQFFLYYLAGLWLTKDLRCYVDISKKHTKTQVKMLKKHK